MYPDFSYLLHDLFGTNLGHPFSVIKTYGAVLSVAIVLTFILTKKEIKRMERVRLLMPRQVSFIEKEWKLLPFIFDKIIAFFVGYKLLYAIESGIGAKKEIWFSTKGSFIGGLIGVVFGVCLHFWKNRNNKKIGIKGKRMVFPHESVFTIMLIASIMGLLGAKIIILFENFDELLTNPVEAWKNTGTAFYGGLLGILAGVYFSCKAFKIPVRQFLDAGASAAFFGYGIGRLGCHLSGDGDWGIANSTTIPEWWFLPKFLWSYDYPNNVVNKGTLIENCSGSYCHYLNPPVLPTSFYEFIIAILLGVLILSLRKKLKRPGALFAIYLVANGMERFAIEFIRINKKFDVLGFSLSQSQIVAIFLMAIGFFFFLNFKKTNNGEYLISPSTPPPPSSRC